MHQMINVPRCTDTCRLFDQCLAKKVSLIQYAQSPKHPVINVTKCLGSAEATLLVPDSISN